LEQLLLETANPLLLAGQLGVRLSRLFPQFLALRPQGLVLVGQALVLPADEAHGVLDAHEFVVLLLDELPLGLLLLLLQRLLLLVAQLGQSHLVADALLHAQNQVLVFPRLVPGLPH
jgi:hypothetical protein